MAFLYLEVAMVFLLLWQLYYFVGPRWNGGNLLFFQNTVSELEVYLFLLNAFFFALIFIRITLRDENVMKMHKKFSEVVLGKAKEKVFGVERQVLFFLVLQFTFAFILAIAIAFYLDPELQFPGLEKVAFPFNLIAFLAFLIFGFYVFAQTKPFRNDVYDEGFLQKKLMPARRLFRTKRITNKKNDTIRIKSEK